MTKIFYEFDSTSYVTREGDPDDRWDRDDTSTTWYPPTEVTLTDKNKWRSETDDLPWEVKTGDTVYMVWVQYSTGDSFGCSDGEYHEVVGWYQNAADAEKCLSAIYNEPNKSYSFEDGGNTVQVPTFDGKATRPLYTGSWKGYFESLDTVNIEKLEVRP